jgi:lambda repressor-like predicted transcriptional regulator
MADIFSAAGDYTESIKQQGWNLAEFSLKRDHNGAATGEARYTRKIDGIGRIIANVLDTEPSHFKVEFGTDHDFVRAECVSGPVKIFPVVGPAEIAAYRVDVEERAKQLGVSADDTEYVEYAQSPKSLRKLIARRARNADTEDVK